MEKIQSWLDAASRALWRAFEKDLALMESFLDRTEAVFTIIETKLFPPRQ